MMFSAVGQFIRSHRRSSLARLAAVAAEKYLRAFHNQGSYDFARNGERFVLQRFGRWKHDPVMWDVGANHGQWAKEAHAIIPAAKITSFEIIPSIARTLGGEHWWHVVECGLSDRDGMIDVTWSHNHDDASSVTPGDSRWFDAVEVIRVPVTTLDSYLNSADAPDFIKIDTEGHEAAILDGGHKLFAERPPALIQFEYGTTWVPAERMLRPVWKRLESYGYCIGRLFPNHVDFKTFALSDENYRMGNFVAVHNPDLRSLLGP